MDTPHPQTMDTSAYLASTALRVPPTQPSPPRPHPHRLGSAHLAPHVGPPSASQRFTRVSTWRDAVVPHIALRSDAASAAALGLRVDACPTPAADAFRTRDRSASASSSDGSRDGTSPAGTSSSDLEAERSLPGGPGAPQLPTRGSTFSIPPCPSRSASAGSEVWAALTPQTQGGHGRAGPLARAASSLGECTTVPRATSVPSRSATLGEGPCGTTAQQGKTPCAGKQHAEQQKKVMAEKMVDAVHELLCSTWSSASDSSSFTSSPSPSASSDECAAASMSSPKCGKALVPLRIFIREILRRSKSSCGTLRCAQFYLTNLRSRLIPADGLSGAPRTTLPNDSPLLCPRRAFLAALVLSHKFLHDRVYSNRAWAKVSELDVREISRAELALATALDWNLWVGKAAEVDSLRADSAPAMLAPPPVWRNGLPIRPDYSTPTESLPTAISSWRAGVRQPTASPESLSPASAMHPVKGFGASISVSPEGMDKVGDNPAAGAAASPHPAVQPGQLSASASQSAFSQASSCTILSSCLPGLTLDGRSDWDGSVSASGISPNTWVMVSGTAPDVQIVNAGEEGAEDGRPAEAAVMCLDRLSRVGAALCHNHKKRTSPLAVELLARDADVNACEHSWEAQSSKRRRVLGGEA